MTQRMRQRGGTRPTTEECRRCKLYRHPWDTENAEYDFDLTRPVWRHVVTMHCPQCLSTRRDLLDAAYDKIRSDYEHSPEYRAYLDGKEAPTLRDLRRIMVQGYIEKRTA